MSCCGFTIPGMTSCGCGGRGRCSCGSKGAGGSTADAATAGIPGYSPAGGGFRGRVLPFRWARFQACPTSQSGGGVHWGTGLPPGAWAGVNCGYMPAGGVIPRHQHLLEHMW